MSKDLEATGAIQHIDELIEELDEGLYAVSPGAEETIATLRGAWLDLAALINAGKNPDWSVL